MVNSPAQLPYPPPGPWWKEGWIFLWHKKDVIRAELCFLQTLAENSTWCRWCFLSVEGKTIWKFNDELPVLMEFIFVAIAWVKGSEYFPTSARCLVFLSFAQHFEAGPRSLSPPHAHKQAHAQARTSQNHSPSVQFTKGVCSFCGH